MQVSAQRSTMETKGTTSSCRVFPASSSCRVQIATLSKLQTRNIRSSFVMAKNKS